MPSSADDSDDVDPETERAIRRAVREEIRGGVRALSQIGGGLLLGFFALPALAGVLLVLDVPLLVVLFACVGALLALGAYAWGLPPFR
ncbi:MULTISPECIES: hypothetical protein [Halolamina]|uniref:Uncharacterized protein n=1 Tax=Halolamina pelagica TaxID=699431 RepID=A0A1I5RVV4_9EURY|nr:MULTISPECIES: hypothetical protein [Halolamina]NHX35374.1 hypothetical protein [Halolamina sp. R1-12]SFP62658.1 hypothetical protein SAMN05216277_105171 [Halolamina pelagica]